MLVSRTDPRRDPGTRPGRCHVRALALLVATVLMGGLLGSCSTEISEQDLAAQDKLVQLSNRLAATHARVAQARRLVKRERAAAARRARQLRRAVAPQVRPVRQSGFSLEWLCGPIKRGESTASRLAAREREVKRKRALYYLNLSCPSVRS